MKSVLLIALFSFPAIVGAQATMPNQPHIYVEGRGQVEVEPNTFTINATLSAVHGEMSIAEQLLKEKLADFVAACELAGLDREQIRLSVMRVQPDYDYEDGKRTKTGYSLSYQVRIKLSPIEGHSELLQSVIASNTVTRVDAGYSAENVDGSLNEAQMLALDDARVRAERLAERAGATLGPVYSISEFNLRNMEGAQLIPQRALLAPRSSLFARGAGHSREESATLPLEPDTLGAEAEVYVVYLLSYNISDYLVPKPNQTQ